MSLLTVHCRARRNRVQVSIVALMVAFSTMSYFDRTIMSIAGPTIMKEFALSESDMGAIYAAFLISYAAMNVPGGYLADRLGPRLVLTLTGVGAGLFSMLTALGGRPGLGTYLGIVPAFLLIRFVMGLCTGPLYPTCARTMRNWLPATWHARVQGFITGGAGLGAATSPVLFAWMIAHYGWRISFGLAGVATLTLALIWFWCVLDHPSGHNEIPERSGIWPSGVGGELQTKGREATPWRELLTNRHLVLLTLGCFTVAYFEYVFFFWIYYYLAEIRHFEPAQSTIATTVVFLTGTVMSPVGGWASDRLVTRHGEKIGRRMVPIVSLTLSAILLCLGINLAGKVASVALLSLSLGCALFSDGSYWAAAISLGGKQAGVACGILNTGANLGGVAPYVAPVIASYAGWAWGLYSASIILMLAVLTWFFIDPAKGLD